MKCFSKYVTCVFLGDLKEPHGNWASERPDFSSAGETSGMTVEQDVLNGRVLLFFFKIP